jgi:hypothetical protein
MRFSKILVVCLELALLVGLAPNQFASLTAVSSSVSTAIVADGGAPPPIPPMADGGAPPPVPPMIADGGAPPPVPPAMADGGAPPPVPPVIADGGAPPPVPPVTIGRASLGLGIAA